MSFERERWARFCNKALEMAGSVERVDHRSHADRGIDAMPGEHDGVAVTAIKRRGDVSVVQQRRDAARLEPEATQDDIDAILRELVTAKAELDAERAAGVPDMFSASLETLDEAVKAASRKVAPKPAPRWRGGLEK